MASEAKETRSEQMLYWEGQLKQRLTLLTEKGVESKKISKDATVRKLRAKIRDTDKRLQAIQQKEKKVAEMARIKAEKLAAGAN